MTTEWPLGKRLAFRFLFIYLALYCTVFLGENFFRFVPREPLEAFVFALGRLLGVDATRRISGSGDQTYYYVQCLCFVLLAGAGTLLWSISGRKRTNDRTLYLSLRVLVRITLGCVLISYGANKLFASQMPLPNEARLIETFGSASPMGLLWAFMGASPAYQSFTGLIELVSGLLLFFSRTTLLGALISIVAMTQVAALNLAYDVPVKLASLHFLGMGLFLAAEDAQRLINLLVLNRPTSPASTETVLQKPSLLRAAFAVKLLFLAGIAGRELFLGYDLRLRQASTLDQQKYPLLNRGFHWISETPFNR